MARKAAWDDTGDADLGPYAKSRSTRWGRVFVGLFLIAAATFVAAYYVPLYRAHRRLDARYRELVQKSQSLVEGVNRAQLDLKAMTEQRDQLQAEREQRESAKKVEADGLARVRAALTPKLDKLSKKGLALLVVDGSAVYVALDSAFVFLPQKLDVAPAARLLLCDAIKGSEAKSITVHGSLGQGVSAAPALAKSYPSPIELSAARAVAVARVLESGCKVPPAQLSAIGNGVRDALAMPLSTFKPSDRIELELSLR